MTGRDPNTNPLTPLEWAIFEMNLVEYVRQETEGRAENGMPPAND